MYLGMPCEPPSGAPRGTSVMLPILAVGPRCPGGRPPAAARAAGRRAELAQDRRDVVVDRAHREHEPLGDLRVLQPLADERRAPRARGRCSPAALSAARAAAAEPADAPRAAAELRERARHVACRASAASYTQPNAPPRRPRPRRARPVAARARTARASRRRLDGRGPARWRQTASSPSAPLVGLLRARAPPRVVDRRDARPRRRRPATPAAAKSDGRRAEPLQLARRRRASSSASSSSSPRPPGSPRRARRRRARPSG